MYPRPIPLRRVVHLLSFAPRLENIPWVAEWDVDMLRFFAKAYEAVPFQPCVVDIGSLEVLFQEMGAGVRYGYYNLHVQPRIGGEGRGSRAIRFAMTLPK